MTFDFDGAPLAYQPGQTVAAALWAHGQVAWRQTERSAERRGYYCGDGFCYDCLVVVDGRGNVRACRTLAQTGMQVMAQVGFGAL